MNGFNRSYMYRSTDTEKKVRKTKNHRGEVCKYFPPFLKLHYHDCPVVMKPCPIHENLFHHAEKQQKGDEEQNAGREQNVIISFHPSTKTERLLQPIKSLLAHCNSETKINFQYYSPDNGLGKESMKSQNGQTTYENIKRSFNNNIFVEKTKSFVANKTNKVKKLKQCFHSPCNSIAQRTRSQTSVKDKINQILREEAKKNVFYNMVPEIPPDEKKFEHPSKWFYSKGSFKHDFLPDEKLDSDFITVTQQGKNNAIHHKVFEIKHRKGVNDIPFVGFPKQPSHFVYSAVNVSGEPANKTTKQENYDQKDRDYEKALRDETEESERNLDACSSEKTNRSMASSSSGSVYITPFIFVPKGMDDTAGDTRQKVKQTDQAVQAESLNSPKPKSSMKQTQTTKLDSFYEKPPPEVPNTRAVQTSSLFFEKTICHSSRSVYVKDYEPQTATIVDETFIDNERTLMTRNFDEDSYRQAPHSDAVKKRPNSGPKRVTTEMQTCGVCPVRELIIQARWDSGVRDKTAQTDDLWSLQVSVKNFDCTAIKSQIWEPRNRGTQFSDKGIQASSQCNTSNNSEFIHLNSPNVTYVIKPFEQQESDQAIDKLAKTCWGKSHSDSDLLDRLKCVCCRGDNENPLIHSNNASGEKNTYTGAYESGAVAEDEMENRRKTGNITLRTKETVELFSETKGTSTREEELSAAVSDLSELKKIIQEFFERRNLCTMRFCECEKSKIKETKTSHESTLSNFDEPIKEEENKSNLIDKANQTSSDLPRTSVKTQVVQTSEMRKRVDKEVQISQEVVKVGVQTDVQGLLNKSEDGGHDPEKVRFCRTATVDHDSRPKTPLVCSACGRDMRNSKNVETKTDPSRSQQASERQRKSTSPECVESFEIKMRSKKVDGKPSQGCYFGQCSGQIDDKDYINTEKKQTTKPREESTAATNLQGSKIPIPNQSSQGHSKSKDIPSSSSRAQRNAECFTPEWAHKLTSSGCQTPYVITKCLNRCVCDIMTHTSTRKDLVTNSNPTGEKFHSKPDMPPESRREKLDRQNSRTPEYQKNDSKTRKNNPNINILPVIFSPVWPKNLLKQWKSMEKSVIDVPSSYFSRRKMSNQKRSYEKDPDRAVGKKIKVAKESSQEYLPDLVDLLKEGQLEDFNILTSLIGQHPNSQDSFDEQARENLVQSSRETSPENDDDFLEEQFFVSNYDTEEEEEGGSTSEENGEQQFYQFSKMAPKLKSQSYSIVSLNKSFSDAATSKSINGFPYFKNPKKIKRIH